MEEPERPVDIARKQERRKARRCGNSEERMRRNPSRSRSSPRRRASLRSPLTSPRLHEFKYKRTSRGKLNPSLDSTLRRRVHVYGAFYAGIIAAFNIFTEDYIQLKNIHFDSKTLDTIRKIFYQYHYSLRIQFEKKKKLLFAHGYLKVFYRHHTISHTTVSDLQKECKPCLVPLSNWDARVQ